MNPYLARKREQYEALRSSIEGLQTRAAEENRDLTADELRSVQDQGEAAKGLASEIESLTEIQNRHAAVAKLGAEIAAGTRDGGTETRAGAERLTGGTQTRDRDPGHYRKDGSEHSFFSDLFHARSLQDEGAMRRLVEHNRALNQAAEGPGVIPPVWMTQEFAEIARQQRRVASAVRQIPLSSPAAISMPKQTARAGTVAELVTEGTSTTSFVDGWDSAVDTVAPKATSGGQKVTRQLLDASNPAIDMLIYSDLIADYNRAVENKVVAAMISSAPTATKTYASDATNWLATSDASKSDDLVDLLTAVRNARKLPADVIVMSVTRYGDHLKLKDGSGRPLIPLDSNAPMNVIGTGSVAVDGRIHGVGLLASDGITQYPESIVAARASDTILFESPVLRFRYEEPDGPEVIRLGIWAYTAVYVKYSGDSVKRVQITAA